MAAFFKNKSAGWYLSAVSTLLAVVALIAYIVFGTSSQTFVPAICICLVAAVVLGAAMVLYQGALEGYAAIAMAALMMVSFLLLANNSIDDITAFFVGMGNYFGNAENVGPRVLVAVFMLLSLLAELIAAFMRRVKGCPVKVQG